MPEKTVLGPTVVFTSGRDDETGLVEFEAQEIGDGARIINWKMSFRLTQFQLRCLAEQAMEASESLARGEPKHPPGIKLIDPDKVDG